MGIMSKLAKAGLAKRAMTEARKPENQAKAKELAKSVQEKMAQRKGSRGPGSTGSTTPTTPAPKP
jgi:hypothetical protein